MARRLPELLLLLGALALLAGCGGSGESGHKYNFSKSEEWSIFESEIEGEPGWDKAAAHELRLLVENEGRSPHQAEDCYLTRELPGEWGKGCGVFARFEARHGILKKANAQFAHQDEVEKNCGPGFYANAHMAEGPRGNPIESLKIGCADVGEKRWPLTVPDGLLQCESLVIGGLPVERVTFTAPDGTAYAVNGHALDAGYPDIDPIWKADPTGVAPKVVIGPLISKGLHLCRQAQ